jgi:hypothetical protein
MHEHIEGRPDRVVDHCSSGAECFEQHNFSYKGARKELFGDLELQKDDRGYYVRCVYCESNIYEGVGPGKIPGNSIMNVEHTWPQSRFGGKDKGMEKSDLHHLFPTVSGANSVRGNDEFGEVDKIAQRPCGQALSGTAVGSLSSSRVFEPPASHKGNVARALFYFAVRYQMQISAQQEAFLRKWNVQDPVDDEERLRNDKVFQVQGNRNPFVDHPEWADAIQDF